MILDDTLFASYIEIQSTEVHIKNKQRHANFHFIYVHVVVIKWNQALFAYNDGSNNILWVI